MMSNADRFDRFVALGFCNQPRLTDHSASRDRYDDLADDDAKPKKTTKPKRRVVTPGSKSR